MCEEVKNVTVCPALEGWRGWRGRRQHRSVTVTVVIWCLDCIRQYRTLVSYQRYGYTVCDQYMYKYETVLPIHPNNNTIH